MKKLLACLCALVMYSQGTYSAEQHKGAEPVSISSCSKEFSFDERNVNHPDEKGHTILMKLAQKEEAPHFGIRNIDNERRASQCFTLLLQHGADLNLKDHEGRDASTIALLSDNKPIVMSVLAHIGNHKEAIKDPHTLQLLHIYRGEIVPIPAVGNEIPTMESIPREVKDMYRVANQSQNYKMVEELYGKYFQKFMEPILSQITTSKVYFFHKPLWAYNIIQIKDYTRSRIKEILPVIIPKSALEEKNGKLYYKEIPLMKKPTRGGNIGRILGRNRLETGIKAMKFQDKFAVPRKFLVLDDENKDLHNLKVDVTMPFTRSKEERFPTTTEIGLIKIVIKGALMYAEEIEGDFPPANIMEERDFKQLCKNAGFVDFAKDKDTMGKEDVLKNFIKGKDGKIYFIDTEDNKNFLPVDRNLPKNIFTEMKTIKSLAFDPMLDEIEFNLTDADLH